MSARVRPGQDVARPRGSTAVQARRTEPPTSLDYFPTPPWATRTLCEWLFQSDDACGAQSCWEPAAGEGHMARALAEYFCGVEASDVFDYGIGAGVRDFLFDRETTADWIVTNPPFLLAERFALHGLDRARTGVALLVRTVFLEGVQRHRRLFQASPPTYVLQFSERVPMHRGRLDPKGKSATAYCWLVWVKNYALATRLCWIAPCRARLEEPGDYGSPQPWRDTPSW